MPLESLRFGGASSATYDARHYLPPPPRALAPPPRRAATGSEHVSNAVLEQILYQLDILTQVLFINLLFLIFVCLFLFVCVSQFHIARLHIVLYISDVMLVSCWISLSAEINARAYPGHVAFFGMYIGKLLNII